MGRDVRMNVSVFFFLMLWCSCTAVQAFEEEHDEQRRQATFFRKTRSSETFILKLV